MVRPPRSLSPTTAVLPTDPRPALSFLCSCLLRSFPPMKHEPCRLLRDADLLGKLHGTDALSRCNEQVHGIEPFVQRNVRPLENRACTDGEIQLAGIAAIEAALAGCDAFGSFAGRA